MGLELGLSCLGFGDGAELFVLFLLFAGGRAKPGDDRPGIDSGLAILVLLPNFYCNLVKDDPVSWKSSCRESVLITNSLKAPSVQSFI